MSYRGIPFCLLLASALAGCETSAPQNLTTLRRPTADQALLASYTQTPSRVASPKTHVVTFVRPSQAASHIAVPVSLNDGPPRAFILDTGAPVTTVLISKQLLKLASVAQRLDAATPTRIQGISGDAATAYGITAIPTTVFIDRDGNIVTSSQGALDAAELQQGIERIR